VKLISDISDFWLLEMKECISIAFIYLFIFVVLGFKLRAYTYQPCFVMGFIEIGSHELFPQGDFEPKSY
jgi:hypothetical protein